jgi:hypothetical protein
MKNREGMKFCRNEQNSRLGAAHYAHFTRLSPAQMGPNSRLVAAHFEQISRQAAAQLAFSWSPSLQN